MKHLIRLLIALLFFSPYFACIWDQLLLDPFECSPISGDRSSFWVLENSKDYETKRSAWKNIAVTKKFDKLESKVIIYTDNALEESLNSDEMNEFQRRIDEIANNFNTITYPKVTEAFGKPYDIDENGKTIIVLTKFHISGLVGYFFNLDFYCKNYIKEYNKQKGTVVQSNQGDVVYINYNQFDYSDVNIHQTIAHEFQHLINYSSRMGDRKLMDTWINEGLSEVAGHVSYGIVKNRISDYNKDYRSDKYNGLYYWGKNADVLDYAMSYLFFQYMWEHSEKSNLFKNINSFHSTGLGAIYYAISRDAELGKWGNNPEEIFNKIVLSWYATNAGVTDNGKYNYGNDDDSIKVHEDSEENFKHSEDNTILAEVAYHDKKYKEVFLESGAAVIVKMEKEFIDQIVKKDGMLYLSINFDGSGEDFTGNAKGNLFIVVNNNYTPATSYKISTNLPIAARRVNMISFAEAASEENEPNVSAKVVDFTINFENE